MHPDQVLPSHLPTIPTMGPVIYPSLIVPMIIWHPKSIDTIEDLLAQKKNHLGLLLNRSETVTDQPILKELYPTGIAVRILKRIKLPDGSIQVLVQGLKRFKAKRFIATDPHLISEAEYLDEGLPEKSIEIDALTRSIINHVKELSETHPFFNEEMKFALLNAPHSGIAADIVAFALGLSKVDAQAFLEIISVKARFEKLLFLLKRERDVATIQKKINDEVNLKINTLQREFFLREQLKQIKKELGMEEAGKDKDSRSFKERIEAAKMPDDVKKTALQELQKFETLSEQSPEYSLTRNYLDILCDLPWSIETEDQLSISHARKVLDADHTGLEKVKERILEFLAVRNLQTTRKGGSKKGSIILLVGPPGVGKTSIGKSIAKAMGRKFYRFSLGGMRDEAEIKGHRRTYIGAMPGKFIQAAKRAGSKNAVILLDEIDKLSTSYQGDPGSALLEVLDPEQNKSFLDHYLDVPFDLSQMIFIATANTTQTLPAPLLDRMEVIELAGYTFEEKEQIARRHLIPKVLKQTGIKSTELKFDKDAVKSLILDYSREPGLRTLEQLFLKLCRKTAAKIVERNESRARLKFPLVIHEEDLQAYLGPKRFSFNLAQKMTLPGVMVGLAWTQMGGEILFIEATDLPGSGQLKMTGQMGEVMIESAQIAWTFVKKRLMEEFQVSHNQFKEKDIHIHIPAGAIPKDGPSAGITLASTIYSLLTRRPAINLTAMTGELSLTGRVLPIGGIREKLLAARRAGITRVIIPKENQKDLYDVPAEVLKSLEIHYVSHVDEVFDLVIAPKAKLPATKHFAKKSAIKPKGKVKKDPGSSYLYKN